MARARKIYGMLKPNGALHDDGWGIPIIGSRAFCRGYLGPHSREWKIVEVRVIVAPGGNG